MKGPHAETWRQRFAIDRCHSKVSGNDSSRTKERSGEIM
jgi:hypothetical protein